MPEDIIALLTRIANEAGIPPAIFIAIARWESGLNPNQLHDNNTGAGLFACNINGRGSGYTIEQLKDPELNARLSAAELGQVWRTSKAEGKTDAQAIEDLWYKGQRPDSTSPEGAVATKNAISYTIQQAGVPQTQEITVPKITQRGVPEFTTRTITTPATGVGTDTGPIPPNRADYTDPTGYFDSAGYNDAYIAYTQAITAEENYKALMAGEDEAGLSEYFSAIIPLMHARIAGGELEASKATLELQKRLNALTQGDDLYQKLLGTSLAPGQEYIPGRGPGGLYEKMGLTSEKAHTVSINPMAAALMIMGKTPEMGATPDTSFEAALAMAKELQAASGPPAAAVAPPTTAPSTYAAALTPSAPTAAPAPYTGGSADVRAGVAMQPPVRQDRIPPVGPAIPPNYEAPMEIVSRYPPEMANMGDWWYNTSGQKFVWLAGGWKLASATGY